MQQGHEARFFDVDLELIRHRLVGLNAACVCPRRLVRRVVLENDATRGRGGWASVRSDGAQHVLTFTQGGAATDSGGRPPELEVAVADFGLAQRIMEGLGLEVTRRQESHREEWRLQALTFSLAEWPGLPPFLEIDGPDAGSVQWAARQLGLEPVQASAGADPPGRVIATPQAEPAGTPPPAAAPREQRAAGPSTAPQRQEVRSFGVAELGWSSFVTETEPGRHLVMWAVVLENTNLRHYCEQPAIQITARDQNGHIVGTGDQVLHLFPPGGRIAWASSMRTKGPPHTLEVAPKPADWYPTPAQPEDFPAFGYRDVRFLVQGRSCSVTGELVNPYPAAADEVAVTALFRNRQGRLVGGQTAFVTDLPAHGAVPFRLGGEVPEHSGPVTSLDLITIPSPSGSGDPWDSVLGRC
ncbi:MAG: adenylate cyclase, class 2 [Streptosporangiaceae bacterium]|jgi:adenylate cyclase class 2|nr:hypothetical protein [Streptosporangiaceae bacterium]MDX6431028.1 adenylate cyclase, class 2 [Streptosporangiaceae bacterium]